jgi:hypothetical protein
MATLAVRKGVLTSPGATGDQTVSLSTGGSWPASTTPKAVILWTSYATAAGQSGISAQWSHGFGTNDAAAVQNAFVNWNSLDGALSGAPSWGCNTTFILRGMTPSTTGTTEDYAATLVSLGSDQFVINWSNLPATASIKVHYLALGGDALSRARVFSFTGNNAATHDITVVAGGGQPKVVFIAGGGGSGLTNGASGAGNCGIGVGLLDGTARCSWLWEEDGVAAMNVYLRQINEMIVARGVATAGSTVIDQATMSSSSHPTDGFELTNSNAFANSYVGLALYGTDLEVALGTLDSSTSTNGTDTISLGTGDAEAAFIWGGNMPTSASDISADNTALLGAWGIGAADSDGNEGHAAIATDDAAADEQSGQTHSETKGIQTINPGATPALMGEADVTMSGGTVTATWTDADNVSREKNVLVLGAVSTSANDLAGTIASASTVAGAITVERALAGTAASASTVAGALTARAGLAGTAASASTVAGALTVTAGLVGTVASASTVAGNAAALKSLAAAVVSASTVAGALTVSHPLAGTVISASTVAGALTVIGNNDLAGTVAGASTVAGALTVTASLSVAVSSASTVSGTLTNAPPGVITLAGTVASTSTVAGTLLVTKPLAGLVASASTLEGNLTGRAGLVAAVVSASTTSGSLTVSHPLAGLIAGTSTVDGAIVVLRPLAGTVAAVSTLVGDLTNVGPITAVPVLEGGSTQTFSEGSGYALNREGANATMFDEGQDTATGSESTSGVIALIE